MTELLKQDQYSPMSMEEQVLVIYAGINNFLDDYPVSVIKRYESELLEFMHSRKQSVLDQIKTSGKLDDDTVKQLRNALTEFAKTFSVDDS